MSKQTEAMKQSIIEEASIQMTGHPSKDARWFAKSVYEYFMAEQPAQQEPLAMYRNKCSDGSRCLHGCHANEPCYTTPQAQPERRPLTDSQANDIMEKESWGPDATTLNASLLRTIRRTEAAHGITSGKATTKGNT